MKLNIIEKIFIGEYSIKIGNKYHSFNKLAPWMICSVLLTGLTQTGLPYENKTAFNIGMIWVGLNILLFFYPLVFRNRCNPSNIEDVNKFIIKINY